MLLRPAGLKVTRYKIACPLQLQYKTNLRVPSFPLSATAVMLYTGAEAKVTPIYLYICGGVSLLDGKPKQIWGLQYFSIESGASCVQPAVSEDSDKLLGKY